MLNLLKWMNLFSSVVREIDTGEFTESLINTVKAVAPLEHLVIMLFRENTPPLVLYDALDAREHDMFYKQYLKGGYLFSPYYQAWRHQAETDLYRMRDITPEGFIHTDVYKNYYLQSGLADDMGYLIKIDAVSAIFVGFGIYSRKYTSDEYRTFREIAPLLTACSYKHWHRMGKLMPGSSGQERQTHQNLEEAIDNFGSSVLSKREAEIVQMLLRGHTTKSAAAKLNIAPGTVKNHRNNIYFKLDLNSQSELFSLFIQSIIHAGPRQKGDPLKDYFEQPKSY